MAWVTQDDAFRLPPAARHDVHDEYYLPCQKRSRAASEDDDDDFVEIKVKVIASILGIIFFWVWVTAYPKEAGKVFCYLLVGAVAVLYVRKAIQLGWYGLLRLALPALPYVRRAGRIALWPVFKPMDWLDAAAERQRALLRACAAVSEDLAALRASFEAEVKRDLADE
jgi:hypothetical protein